MPVPILWCILSGATLRAMNSPEGWIPLLTALLALAASFGKRTVGQAAGRAEGRLKW